MTVMVNFINESGITLSAPSGAIRPMEKAEVPLEYYNWYVENGWAKPRPTETNKAEGDVKDEEQVQEKVDNLKALLG